MGSAVNVLARRLAEEALSLDPKYGAAYTLFALTYSMEVPLGLSKSPRIRMPKELNQQRKPSLLMTPWLWHTVYWVGSILG